MSDDKKFDDYVKGLFNENPNVPSGLEWDAMNFDLPTPIELQNEPTPAQDSRVRTIYIGLAVLLLLLIFKMCYPNNSKNIAFNNNADSEELLFNDHKSDAIIESKQAIKKSFPSRKSNKATKPEILSPIAQNKETTNTFSKSKNAAKVTLNSPSNKRTKTPINTTITSIPKDNQTTNANNSIDITSQQATPLPIAKVNSTTQSAQILVQPLPTKEVNHLVTSLDMANTIVENKIAVTIVPLTSFEETEKELETTTKVSKSPEVLIGYGYNNFMTSVEENNILKEKVSGILGQSFRAGIQLDISSKWKANVLLKYDRFHSTFEHTRALAPELDIERSVKVYRDEVTFHNNYTNTLGLQLGTARNWKLTKFAQLRTGLAITPTYVMSSTGKTTEGNLVNTLVYDNSIGKISLQGGLNLGLVFPIHQNANLELNYQFNQFFLNDVFINNGISARQQNAFTLMFAYQL